MAKPQVAYQRFFQSVGLPIIGDAAQRGPQSAGQEADDPPGRCCAASAIRGSRGEKNGWLNYQ